MYKSLISLSVDTSKSTRIEHYRLSRQELDVSDVFALLSPSDKGSGKTEIKDLSRLEWVSLPFRQCCVLLELISHVTADEDNRDEIPANQGG